MKKFIITFFVVLFLIGLVFFIPNVNAKNNRYNLPSSFYIDKELYNTLDAKDWDKLEYLAKIAIYKFPNDAIGYFYMGIALDEKGKHKKAIDFYTKAMELRPNIADNYQNRGLAYYRMGDKEKAIADYKKALELEPNHQQAKKQLAIAQGYTIYYPVEFVK